MRVKDARGSLDDHAVEFGGPQGVGKRRTEAVEEIKDTVLLDPQVVQAALGVAQKQPLLPPRVVKGRCRQDEKSEEQGRPHESIPSRKNQKSEAKTPASVGNCLFQL